MVSSVSVDDNCRGRGWTRPNGVVASTGDPAAGAEVIPDSTP
ncbi:hypothetical protein MMEU_1481 [Mycobacterium marinum str. Europe]|nr:hypothetical protein MMEU_1481 [Mycobacterium marinum str. Europe]